MENNQKKLWAHYETLRGITGIYITLFFAVPFLSLCFSSLAHISEINEKIDGAVKLALLSGLKWYAIIMPIITVLFIIWFLCYSDRVEFTENSILYYRCLFANKSRSISFNKITECVFNDGLWKHKGEYNRGRKILIFNKNLIISKFDLYCKLCLAIALNLRDKKIRLVDDNNNLKMIDNYFKIEFMNLSYEQQLKILKYYCKFTRTKYKTGEEILKK